MRRLKQVQRKLQSFMDSTYKTIQFKNEKYILSGMNSQYISHQSCEISRGHHHDEIIIIDEYLIIKKTKDPEKEDASGFDQEREEKNRTVCRIPAFWVKEALISTGLFGIFGLPKWLDTDYVYAYLPNKFREYDEEGSPVWFPGKVELAQITPVVFSFVNTEKAEKENN